MAVTHDASGGTTGTTVSSLTYAHVCAAGAGLIVFVYVETAAATISSVTYNSVALSLQQAGNAGNDGSTLNAYKLSNPSSGSNNVVVTFSGNCNAHSISDSFTLGGALLSTTFTGAFGGAPLQKSGSISSAANRLVYGCIGINNSINSQMTVVAGTEAGAQPAGNRTIVSAWVAGAATSTITWQSAVSAWSTGGLMIDVDVGATASGKFLQMF